MNNPLSEFYRSKEIYVKLPTKGRWYTSKINLTSDGEIGVMPMTIQDEMILNIPDSLYNGESLYEVFKSIVPDIEDPYEISIPDVDVILIAARTITQGKEMEVVSSCPKCKHKESYSIDLTTILSKVQHTPENVEIEYKGLKIFLRPNTLAALTASSIKVLESTKISALIQSNDHDSAKKYMKEAVERATASNLAIIANGIEKIVMPDGNVVTDIVFIIDWLKNLDNKTVNILNEQTKNLNKNGLPETYHFKCSVESCGHEYNTSIDFNPTFFFTKK